VLTSPEQRAQWRRDRSSWVDIEPEVVPAQRGSDYLTALRKHWWIVAAVAVFAVVGALAFTLTAVKKYDATATVLLTDSQATSVLPQNSGSRSPDPERDLNTGIQLVTSNAVAHTVQQRLHLPMSVDRLRSEVSVEADGNSNVVSIKVRDPSPTRAAATANAFAAEYVAFRRSSARRLYAQAAHYVKGQLQDLSPRTRARGEGRTLQSRVNDLQLASAVDKGGVEFLDRAAVPTTAASPRPFFNAGVALVIGLLVGWLLAILLRRLA
jgi:polysaccharide biosynthesis transport protein